MKCRRLVRAAVTFVAVVGMGASASAQSSDAGGPTVSLDRTSARPGDTVLVTLTRWESRVVTLSVCGNAAKRGSADCDVTASQAVGRSRDGSRRPAPLRITVPPVGCPCVVRATTLEHERAVLVPIEVLGAPVEPVVEPALSSLLAVSLDVVAAPHGFVDTVRSSLGGHTTYEVTVAVMNRSHDPLEGVTVVGAVGRRPGDERVAFKLPRPGSLPPGQTWRSTVEVRLPAPVLGPCVWRVTASGAGPAVHGERSVRHRPLGLVVLVAVLVVDVTVIVIRRGARRLRPTAGRSPAVARGAGGPHLAR